MFTWDQSPLSRRRLLMVIDNHVDDTQLDFDEADKATVCARLQETFGIAGDV